MKQKNFIYDYSLPIGIGFIAITMTGLMVSWSSLWALAHIWPFLLIVISLGVLLHSYWRYAPRLLNTLAVLGALSAIIFASQLGWSSPTAVFSFYLTAHDEVFIGPSMPGSGNVVTEVRPVDGFKGIDIEYPAQVLVQQGEVEALKIEAEDNLLPDIRTDVQDAMLEIFYKRTGSSQINPTKPVIITITVKDIDEVNFSRTGELTLDRLKIGNISIALKGNGTLNVKEIRAKNFGVSMSGTGNATVSGQADDLYVSVNGAGSFEGAALHGKSACVYIRGDGGATLWVDDTLDAKISGAGHINYIGKPQVTKRINYGRFMSSVQTSRCG